MTDTDLTGRLGVNLVEGIVLRELGWIFREQPISDEGIDAQVEEKLGGRSTGRLIALQIKSGPSYFRESTEGGWILRFGERQVGLWTGYALPVVLVVVNPETEEVYWEQLSDASLSKTRKGYKVQVPIGNTLRGAKGRWARIAGGIEARATARYEMALSTLPPSTQEAIERVKSLDPTAAAVLAMHLSDGRRSPHSTVESILLASPWWVDSPDGNGYRALASYSASHDDLLQSAVAFEVAAERDDSRRGPLLAAAGLNAMGDDRAWSRELLDRAAASPEADVLVRIGYALLNHPEGDAGPRVAAPPLDPLDPAVQRSAAAQAFLGDQALRAGHFDVSVDHARAALRLEPGNSAYMSDLAGALGRRAMASSGGRDDLTEACQLLMAAVDQIHAWDGPTGEPLRELLRLLALSGDNEGTLAYSLTSPRGTATPEEALRQEVVRYALIAAYQLGLDEDLAKLGTMLNDSDQSRLDRARVDLISLSEDDERSLWGMIADDAAASDDSQKLVTAVLHLGSLGVDQSQRLGPLVSRRIVPEAAMRLAGVAARATSDLEEALPELRALARTDIASAEHLMLVLARSGRRVEASEAAEDAFATFHQTHFLVASAQFLIDAKEWQRAEAAAQRAVAGTGFPRDRSRLLTFLASRHAERNEWEEAVELLTQVLALHSEVRDSDVWQLVRAQVHLADSRSAAATVTRYRPRVSTQEDAETWLRAMIVQPWDQETASEALALALRFENEPSVSLPLLWHLTTKTTSAEEAEDSELPTLDPDHRPVVTADIRRDAFAAIDRHARREDGSPSVQRIEGSDEHLVEELSRVLEEKSRNQEALVKLLREVQRGKVPVGLLAGATRRSYAATLVQELAGPIIAAAADDDEHDRDVEDAKQALGQAIAVDSSALLVTGLVEDGAALRGRFARLRFPTDARRDILRATVEIQGLAASPGTLAWDSAARRPVLHELSSTDYLQYVRRVEAMEGAAAETRSQVVTQIPLLGTLADRPGNECWMAAIQLAHDEKCSLWTDEIGQRRLARALGVACFGTPALLEALSDTQIEALPAGAADDEVAKLVSVRHTWVRRLLREGVVDLPATLDDVLQLAGDEDWQPRRAATVLTRPAWWAWRFSGLADWSAIASSVATHAPDLVLHWQYAAMLGAARAYVDPQYAAAMVAAIAIEGVGSGPNVEDCANGLRTGRLIAESESIADPAAQLPLIVTVYEQEGRLLGADDFTSTVLARVGG
ncbi:DUF4365 domain-containing protein [Phycicoccus avicenniae]|uniref:DUF4365 domain-containing protein n=1 Tax=Phycicoccus avicenniae TaxID=2828860 RepID=UPI003D2946B3